MQTPRAPQPATPVNFDVPAGACDCHNHIFGPQDKFPLVANRLYTPPLALPEEMAAMNKACHFDRRAIVTASIYGIDNSVTLWGMKAFGANARGIAVIDPEKTPESDLKTMHDAGVRGARLAFVEGNVNDLGLAQKALQSTIDRIKPYGWHVDTYMTPTLLVGLKKQIEAAPVTFVLDHFSGLVAELGMEQPGLADVIELVGSGKAYIKIGPDRAWAYPGVGLSLTQTRPAPNYAGIVPIAKALIAANPDRIVWGTDWPHPGIMPRPELKPTDILPDFPIDDALMLNQLPVWAPDAATREKILVTNPARLYGF